MKEMKVVKKDYKITVEFTFPELGLPSESDHDEYKELMLELTQQHQLQDESYLDPSSIEYKLANEGYIPTFKVEAKDSRA